MAVLHLSSLVIMDDIKLPFCRLLDEVYSELLLNSILASSFMTLATVLSVSARLEKLGR